ncbi:MAG: GNAT family N-acetyltransferase [Candidatus Bathyarchaeota archaeon]|nr:GNAT family N-acetyltransferase [Candidatus Bathyarchaeota archaeon]
MNAGKATHHFIAKDGREVIFRPPRWEDLDDLLGFINSLVEEGAEILRNQKVTRDEEADWLGRKLADMAKGNLFWLVAEVDGTVIASSELKTGTGYSSHVGEIGVGVKREYRDVGVGTELLNALLSHAKTIGLELLTLTVSSSNKRAIHVYERIGFEETGRIPHNLFKNGTYRDSIIMTKIL